jgi:hypothetical protein
MLNAISLSGWMDGMRFLMWRNIKKPVLLLKC